MKLVVSSDEVEQPPLLSNIKNELTVAISSLSIGGAERIVIDWATRIYPRWRAHLVVLRDRKDEWPVPSFVRITRIGDPRNRLEKLKLVGQEIAASNNPVCVCHLLNKQERDALAEYGAKIVVVLHNAKNGWPEDISNLSGSFQTIAVSESCASDIKENGWRGHISVIRHIPSHLKFPPDARKKFRKAWNIPVDATVIGMVGAIKPQKNYLFALEILKNLLLKQEAYLVILGGPIGADARQNWDVVINKINHLGIRHRVAMPGFIANAAVCLPAFDIVLNTSHFEGLSIATLEALSAGMPIVASEVGGQGEIRSEGLTFIPKDAPPEDWASMIQKRIGLKFESPSWSSFPAFRLWTLAGLARPVESSDKVLFVTANLNSGGAQRSLVNLAKELKGKISFEIAVAGNSTNSYFYGQLKQAGIKVARSADGWDSFTNAEIIVQKICSENIGMVCFWNLSSKVKLLVVKALGFTKVRFIDVSPGPDSFWSMDEIKESQHLISFNDASYYRRLDALVLKYRGPCPAECSGKVFIIPNGVPEPRKVKKDYAISGAARVVVSGRIAPTKFIVEIIEAMRLLWMKIPAAELHIFGAAEFGHQDYAETVIEAAKDETGKRIFFHGPDFDVASRLPEFDAYVVLGKDQGCPNALLEALAAGLPAIANNDGGTGEQLIHNQTGLLIESRSPEELADALLQIITDRNLAERLGKAGRDRTLESFSMNAMAERFTGLFANGGIGKIQKNNIFGFFRGLLPALIDNSETEEGVWGWKTGV